MLVLLTGCNVTASGDDLTGFIVSMNKLEKDYSLKAEGFIVESAKEASDSSQTPESEVPGSKMPDSEGYSVTEPSAAEKPGTISGKTTLSCFYNSGDSRLLLSFDADEKSRLTAMHLVFKKTDAAVFGDFIRNCATVFLRSEETANKLIESADIPSAFEVKNLKASEFVLEKSKLVLDVTPLGIVLSFYRDC